MPTKELERSKMESMIISKLVQGEKFGLYNNGSSCYFEDGTSIHYADLWSAIRTIHSLPSNHNKNLHDLYPESFTGSHEHKFRKGNLINRLWPLFFENR